MFLYLLIGLFCGMASVFAAVYFYSRAKEGTKSSLIYSSDECLLLEEKNKELINTLHEKELLLARKEQELTNFAENMAKEKDFLLSAHTKELDILTRNHSEKLSLEKEQASSLLEKTKSFYEEKLLLERTGAARSLEEARKTFEAEKNALNSTILSMKKSFEESREDAEKNFRVRTELLKEEFKTLSEKILAEKAGILHNSNKEEWTALLAPLNEKMLLFRKAVEESREKEVELNTALRTELARMAEETRKIGLDADNLAKALKGEQKTQGNFGEFLLEDLLNRSGLVKGVHYECQETLRDDAGHAVTNEQNKKMRPDVIIHYPDGKDLILDSKVSLTAYVDYMNAETEEARKNALARHVQSVRKHVDELDTKNYSSYLRLADRETIDFVIMFIPNEGPFRLAMTEAPSLWEEAFRKKVMIISPTNLIALLRLIHMAWTREEQSRNQREIMETATKLLDRLYGFYKAFNDIGDDLEKVSNTYKDALHRLKGEGKAQSVVKAAEKLVSLGVKKSRVQNLPPRLIPDEQLFEAEGNTQNELPASSGLRQETNTNAFLQE